MSAKRIDNLDVIPIDWSQHGPEVMDLLAKTFSRGSGFWGFLDHMRQGYVEQGGLYRPEHSRIGVLDGKIVTHWGVWGHRLRFGQARLRVAGIGAVATHGEYGKRGLMTRTIHAWLDEMQRQGHYDATLLYGIGSFYHRYGYVQAWPGQRFVVPLAELPEAKTPRLSSIPPEAHKDLDRLYNRHAADLAGTAERPSYVRHGSRDIETHAWKNPRGAIAGYVRVRMRGAEFQCIEAIGDQETALAVVRKLAEKKGKSEVAFELLHVRDPLAGRLRVGSCRFEQTYQRSGGAMIRTLDLVATLRAMAPELAVRLSGSTQADWTGRLTIADARQTVTLAIAADGVQVSERGRPSRHAIRGGEEIIRLVIGSQCPFETVAAYGTKLSGDASKLLPALFPARQPLLAAWDFF